MQANDTKELGTFVGAQRAFGVAAGLVFAAFVLAHGIPTLRHDWSWPIDRAAVVSFLMQATSGWLSVGYGMANAHPTTYLIALPMAAAMWLFGPLAALGMFAFAIGYCCARTAGGVGLGLIALFNPWVYNEVVAGHLVMILAYGALLGLLAEMTRGAGASPVRLALWTILIEPQLQFFLVAVVALFVFALATRKWLPLLAGAIVVLPSAIGVVADRTSLLQTPYSIQWQANQSLSPVALLSLGGYFPGYADRLGLAARVPIWILCALAVAGILIAGRRRAFFWIATAAGFVYLVALGVHGPLDAAYEWVVRTVPESGVFRELYDFGGVFAALLLSLAGAAVARVRALGYVALAAGAVLPITWLFAQPADFWIGAQRYPHPVVTAPPFSRVAFLPAFQPLELRAGGGDGADPDAFVYSGRVAPINEYFPTYPVDMALGRFEQSGDARDLSALGVSETVDRPWLESRSNGSIGLAAAALAAPVTRLRAPQTFAAAPLVSQCAAQRVVARLDGLLACDVFFGDAPGYARVVPLRARGDSVDVSTSWIDARLAFARAPFLAQELGGELTLSSLPHSVQPGSWLLAYVRGQLNAPDGRHLFTSSGSFAWVAIPADATAVICKGLCELVAQTPAFPQLAPHQPALAAEPVPFEKFAPWFYRARCCANGTQLLRLNERFDPAWIALRAWRALPHVRAGLDGNGWVWEGGPGEVFLVQITALLQVLAECAGIACALLLLKALFRAPTKRA